ncbi:SET domain protein [Trichophaea hybrida]|nr:SET domain protein [Trichophaea hybrida]
MSIPEDSFELKNAAFMNWFTGSPNTELNPKVALADLRTVGSGRGLVAIASLGQDELLFRIPRRSILSTETSKLSTLLPTDELASLDPWLALILVLIFETRQLSPWKPYIDLLPENFNSLMFWKPEELSALRGSSVLDKIGKEDADGIFMHKLLPVIKKNRSIFHETILTSIPDGTPFETHFLRVAHRMASVIMSYSFDLAIPGYTSTTPDADSDEEDGVEDDGHYKAMVPLADLLNADADRNNCRLFETPAGLEMRTISSVGSGSELFNDYGPLPRSDLLRRYGYITPNYKQYDVVEITSPLILNTASPSLSAADRAARIEFLLEEGILSDSFDLDHSFDIPEEVLVIVRTLLLSTSEFERYRDNGKHPKSLLTEDVALILTRVLEARLKDYPTTIEEDENILAEDQVQGREYAAVEVRLGEKQILVGVSDHLKQLVWRKRSNPAQESSRRNKKMRAA